MNSAARQFNDSIESSLMSNSQFPGGQLTVALEREVGGGKGGRGEVC
jgi:hypothetical protein